MCPNRHLQQDSAPERTLKSHSVKNERPTPQAPPEAQTAHSQEPFKNPRNLNPLDAPSPPLDLKEGTPRACVRQHCGAGKPQLWFRRLRRRGRDSTCRRAAEKGYTIGAVIIRIGFGVLGHIKTMIILRNPPNSSSNCLRHYSSSSSCCNRRLWEVNASIRVSRLLIRG